ncbi:protein SCO1 homolog, mitochondrial-like [Pecten maximus]|uniref:protein SCO1 homolog, mitochondrial-like n=1 Tax=Pecten maximus TaxID=6579 RepID=UPI0014591B02|nr:protein SCO1 homolog, mitochondrial-like [Pecten maximus]
MERLLTRKVCALWVPCLYSCSRNMSSFHRCVPQKLSHQTPQHLLQRKLQKKSTIILRCAGEMKREKPMSWKLFAVMTVCCGGLYAGYEYFDRRWKKEKIMATYGNVGSPQIGGAWTLTDHNEVERTDKEFRGKWLLVYFGFTHCPDICPDELEKIAKVVDHFNKQPNGPRVKPLFVTIDPERDTKEIMKKYCEEFTPELLGLTGTREQLQSIYEKFHVYFKYGEEDETGDYLVDHTLLTYLMTPDGLYADHFSKRSTFDKMIQNMTLRMDKKESNKS